MDDILKAAIEAIKAAPKTPIKGKEYATVATRVEVFRLHFGLDYGVITDAFDTPDPNVVRVRAVITNPMDRIIASGLAQEDMTHSKINYTSALENAETSAIGRALANLGLLGGEYASFNEMVEALSTEQPAKAPVKMSGDAQNSRPAVNQYKFFIPGSASKEEIDKVFFQIDAITDPDALAAYYNELAPLLPHIPEDDEAEIKASFKARSNQMRG